MNESLAPKLSQLQHWMRWVLMDPRGVAKALEDPGPNEPSPSCPESVADAPPLGREERLSIYAEAYFIRLSSALAKDFEAVRNVLGEDAFRKLVADYLMTCPSRYSSVAEIGRHLDGFLMNHPFSNDLPFLPDLARLEWLMIEAFYGDRASAKLMDSEWPVDKIWLARNNLEQVALKCIPARRRTIKLPLQIRREKLS